MDKRWILILIIIILASGCGYLIAQSSPSIGNAIADVNKSIVTMPFGFSAGETDVASLEIINRKTDEKIIIEDLGKSDIAKDSFEKDIKELSKNDYEIIDNLTSTSPNGVTVYLIHYTDNNNEGLKNESNAYYYTYGHTYSLKLSGFNSIDDLDDKLNFIVDTTKPDYKKSQD